MRRLLKSAWNEITSRGGRISLYRHLIDREWMVQDDDFAAAVHADEATVRQGHDDGLVAGRREGLLEGTKDSS